MDDDKGRAVRAGRNGPSIYAKLMDFTLSEPQANLEAGLRREVQTFADSLGEQFAEQLRHAYTAGVSDGYREAIRELAQDEGET